MLGLSSLDSEEAKFEGVDITSLDDDDSDEEDFDDGEEESDDDAEEEEDFDDGEEDSDDDAEEEEEEIEYAVLGFVEKPKNSRSLLSRFFPSKAGGCPAWLDPVNLPSGRSFLCDICEDPLQFMMQVYAPDDVEHAFHRTLFVFICNSLSCLRRDQHEQWKRRPQNPLRSVKVFRSQLPRHNSFYSSEPPQEKDEPCAAGAELCTWCCTWKGIKECSSCKKALYCSETHQVKHAQQGHDSDCQRSRAADLCATSLNDKQTAPAEIKKAACTTIWPEFEIIREDEKEFDRQATDNGCSSKLISRKTDDLTKMFMKASEGDDEKKSWASFANRISWAPQQVLRYCRDSDAKPLWQMSSGQPSKADIPPCRHCGGPLGFEFQILPQLLYYFKVKNDVDSLDWASIAVYTCEASCKASVAYSEEFAWVQLG